MKNKILISFFTLLGCFLTAISQEVLTLEEAIKQALDKNHGILVVKNNLKVAENKATIGNAGMLPTVAISGNTNLNVSNTKLEFAGGLPPVEREGAQSSQLNANIALNYVLFDGLAMFHTYDLLKIDEEKSRLETRIQIENTILSVANAYYEIARWQSQKEVWQEAVQISKKRYQRAQTYNEFGGNSKVEVLSAQVDLHTDSVNLLNANLSLNRSIRKLNFLLNKNTDDYYLVSNKVEVNQMPAFPELFTQASNNNAALLNAKYNELAADKRLKQLSGNLYPRLAVNAGYGFSSSATEAGIVLSNQNVGPSVGLTLQYSIFEGGKKQIERQNAKILMENAVINSQALEKQMQMELTNAYDLYEYQNQVIELENINVQTAQLNFERTKELFELGKVTNTQFRDAQLNLVRAKTQIANANYLLKLSELDLIRISGTLLQSN